MRQYYTTHLIKGEDLNHHGTLFAARTAAWFVEAAFVAAACEHGDPSEIVCRNVHGMSFSAPVRCGDVIRLTSRVVYAGSTSLMVHVSVISELNHQNAVDGYLTFVTVDRETGKKKTHGIVLDDPKDEQESQQRQAAAKIRTGG